MLVIKYKLENNSRQLENNRKLLMEERTKEIQNFINESRSKIQI